MSAWQSASRFLISNAHTHAEGRSERPGIAWVNDRSVFRMIVQAVPIARRHAKETADALAYDAPASLPVIQNGFKGGFLRRNRPGTRDTLYFKMIFYGQPVLRV